jgi:hypothetical protein
MSQSVARPMMYCFCSSIPDQPLPVLSLFASAFRSATTFVRAKLLGVAAILTTGRRTVSNLLRTVAGLTEGDPSSYHRVLSLAQWSGLTLASLLSRFILRHFWPEGRVRLVGDDTVTEHPGRKVHGKGASCASQCDANLRSSS